jgi:hypothetical protein
MPGRDEAKAKVGRKKRQNAGIGKVTARTLVPWVPDNTHAGSRLDVLCQRLEKWRQALGEPCGGRLQLRLTRQKSWVGWQMRWATSQGRLKNMPWPRRRH